MSKVIAADRHKQILKLLQNNNSVKIIQLAEQLQVSKETIRRDLNYLEEKGLLQKSYGGAIASTRYEFNTISLESRIHENQDSKMKLCEKALSLLPPQAVIFLDSGSTLLCLAELLSKKSGYTILTNSLSAANCLIHSNNRTIITGGQLNPETMSADGLQTIEFLSKIKVDIAFMGTSGFEQHTGPSGTDFLDIQTKQTVLKNAKTSVVIAESQKAGYSALMQYANWRDIDHLITDNGMPDQLRQSLEDMTHVIYTETTTAAPDVY